MTGGWQVEVTEQIGVRGPVLMVRVAIADFWGYQAALAVFRDGSYEPIECARRTPLGAAALEVARQYAAGGRRTTAEVAS